MRARIVLFAEAIHPPIGMLSILWTGMFVAENRTIPSKERRSRSGGDNYLRKSTTIDSHVRSYIVQRPYGFVHGGNKDLVYVNVLHVTRSELSHERIVPLQVQSLSDEEDDLQFTAARNGTSSKSWCRLSHKTYLLSLSACSEDRDTRISSVIL